jgi:hypothetical protein
MERIMRGHLSNAMPLVDKTRFNVLKRSLHILALIQHSSGENWNARTLSDVLSRVPGEKTLDTREIDTCLKKLKELGFPVRTSKGGRNICLDSPLSDNEIIESLSFYMNAVIDAIGIRDCFSSYVRESGTRSLWLIGRVYFASLAKERIILSYHSTKNTEYKDYHINPYRWIYRDNAVYLVGKDITKGIRLFKLNRIRDMSLTDEHFDDDIPSTDDLLKTSLGAFIGSECFRVVIEYPEEYAGRVYEEFGRLELTSEPSVRDGYLRTGFTACDLLTVCTKVFGYGGEVTIIEPKEAREEMKSLLLGNMKAYESGKMMNGEFRA